MSLSSPGTQRGSRVSCFHDTSLGGLDDVSREGRWLPSTSVEQMGATLASWFGVGASDLYNVFPRLQSFSPNINMGYFG